MEALQGVPIPASKFEPDTEKIKRRLLRTGLAPTPKTVHILRKKEIQKHNRKLKRLEDQQQQQSELSSPLSDSQKQSIAEENHFQALKYEYKEFSQAVRGIGNGGRTGALIVGKPWERIENLGFKELASVSKEYSGEKLKKENLKELKEIFETRKHEDLQWILDDDVRLKEEWLDEEKDRSNPVKRRRNEGEVIQYLVHRLSGREFSVNDYRFVRMMKQSELQFTEGQLLRIVDKLGVKGCWKQSMSVVEWVYSLKSHRHCQSRFVYTKLLAVLGRARRPEEALHIFNMMRLDGHIYPDMAAYHSIVVPLGQAGLLRELLKVIECMRQQPSKRTKNMRRKNWDPILEPDLVIYNAILNACVSSREWKSVYWVFTQLRKSGLKPNGATYGLSMEVMLKSGKYDQVHELFRKMKKSGDPTNANTYKVLVRAFWEEGKVNAAIDAVREMEQKGVVGNASVYYELACCLCNNGRWHDALLEVEKMKRLRNMKPLVITFTGMISSAFDGGHIDDCMSIFERMKKDHCAPNIGIINTMLKVYSRNDMFSNAKDLFEEIKRKDCDFASDVIPDGYTYSSMLESAARSLQWEYFEYVYREMALSGFQLDQNKHAMLLVKASKAGKCYLLEHAFDTILEAGEIPNQTLFTEMVIQAIVSYNYERAVNLINTMAHAPYRVSEKRWMKLFTKNRDRISRDNLENLLDSLGNCEVRSEATVLNLGKSLHAFCNSEQNEFKKMEIKEFAPVSELVINDDNGGSFDLNGDLGYDNGEEDEDEDDEIELPMTNYDSDSHERSLPSADDILEAWKDERKKDGILFPLRFRQNQKSF